MEVRRERRRPHVDERITLRRPGVAVTRSTRRGAGGQFLQMVGDQDAGEIGVVFAQLVDALEQVFAGRDVEPGGGLVQQQKARSRHEGASDQRASAFAVGEVRPARLAQSLQAHERHELVGAVEVVLTGRPAGDELDGAGGAGEHDLVHGAGRRQRVVRVDVAESAAQFVYVHPAEPVPEDLGLSAGRMPVGAEDAEQRALAGAVGAEQGPVLAGPDGHRDLVEQESLVTDQVHALDAQHGGIAGEGRGRHQDPSGGRHRVKPKVNRRPDRCSQRSGR